MKSRNPRYQVNVTRKPCMLQSTQKDVPYVRSASSSSVTREDFSNISSFAVRAAILNVEIGILFDPEAVKSIKESQETCINCSHRMNEVIDKPIDVLVNEDVRMDG